MTDRPSQGGIGEGGQWSGILAHGMRRRHGIGSPRTFGITCGSRQPRGPAEVSRLVECPRARSDEGRGPSSEREGERYTWDTDSRVGAASYQHAEPLIADARPAVLLIGHAAAAGRSYMPCRQSRQQAGQAGQPGEAPPTDLITSNVMISCD